MSIGHRRTEEEEEEEEEEKYGEAKKERQENSREGRTMSGEKMQWRGGGR